MVSSQAGTGGVVPGTASRDLASSEAVRELVVIDTSVVFKWFVAFGEEGLDDAARLLRAHQHGSISLVAPSTMPVEVANTLRYAVPSSEDAVALFGDFGLIDITLVEPTHQSLLAAMRRADETDLTVYDALFLQLAEQLECPLATADRAFAAVETPIEVMIFDS